MHGACYSERRLASPRRARRKLASTSASAISAHAPALAGPTLQPQPPSRRPTSWANAYLSGMGEAMRTNPTRPKCSGQVLFLTMSTTF